MVVETLALMAVIISLGIAAYCHAVAAIERQSAKLWRESHERTLRAIQDEIEDACESMVPVTESATERIQRLRRLIE